MSAARANQAGIQQLLAGSAQAASSILPGSPPPEETAFLESPEPVVRQSALTQAGTAQLQSARQSETTSHHHAAATGTTGVDSTEEPSDKERSLGEIRRQRVEARDARARARRLDVNQAKTREKSLAVRRASSLVCVGLLFLALGVLLGAALAVKHPNKFGWLKG